MIKRLLFLNLIFIFVCLEGFSLSLDEAITDILATHPAIKEKVKDYNSAVHLLEKTSTAFKPKLDIQAEIGLEDVENSSTRHSNKTSDVNAFRIVGKKLIYDGNRSLFDVASRNSICRRALFQVFETANKITFETIESYLELIKSFELVRLAQENVDVHHRILESIQLRVKSGADGKAERERVQGRLARTEGVLIVRKNNYRKAIYNMQKYLGRIVDGKELFKPDLKIYFLPSSLKIAIEKMLSEHPTLMAATYNIEQKKNEFKRDLSEFKPYVSFEAARNLSGNYSGVNSYDKESSVMLKLSYRLFDGGERANLVKSSKSQIHKERQARDNVARSLINGIQISWANYKVLESRLGAIRKNILFTGQALNSYKEEFKLGRRMMINILDAESELQNARSLSVSTKFNHLISKYRILYSIGTLIQDLSLSIPFTDEFYASKKLKPSGKDNLPLAKDQDNDNIADKLDVSPNSQTNDVVSEFGETVGKTKEYLEESIQTSSSAAPQVVRSREELASNKITTNVPTKIDFVYFNENSIALSEPSKPLMREMINQIKQKSDEGLVLVEVVTNEKNTYQENYSLSLKRAYNIKRILTNHYIDPHIIDVKATVGNEANEKERNNYMFISVITDPLLFTEGFETLKLKNVQFIPETLTLKDSSIKELNILASRFLSFEKKQFDLIVYSNDFENKLQNQEIAEKRCDILKNFLVEKGIPEDSLTCFPWGSYDEYAVFNKLDEKSNSNMVEFVIRN